MADFHFLRPVALLLVLPLMWLLWRFLKQQQNAASAWASVVDPALQGQLIFADQQKDSRWPLILLALVWLLAVMAIAGPSWERKNVSVYRGLSEQIIALDLSRSMLAEDVLPNRLARARQKISDLLGATGDAQAALLVFSAVPYVITPLTDDVETIRTMLPSLATDLVPAQGSRLSLALLKSMELLNNASSKNGNVLLVTDSAPDEQALAAAKRLVASGYRLSVLAVGSAEGAPIALEDGAYLKDRNGDIVIARLPQRALRELASVGGGQYTAITADDADILRLTRSALLPPASASEEQQRVAEVWIDRGPWLLLLLLPLAGLAFRRGWL